MEHRYEVRVQAESGRWITLAYFAQPLDAERLYQMLEAHGAARRLQIRRVALIADTKPGEEE